MSRMRWSIIRLIWVRELKDQARDRRTLFMIAVLPLLLYPVLGFAVLRFVLGLADRPTTIGVEVAAGTGKNFPPPSTGEYAPFLRDGKLTDPTCAALAEKLKVSFQFLSPADSQAALDEKRIDLLLSASPHFFADLEKAEEKVLDKPASIKVQSQQSADRFRQARMRLDVLLDLWKRGLKATRMQRHHLPTNFDETFAMEEAVPARTAGGTTESLLDLMIRVFPFMLVMWSLAGALYPAVDLCAGEKERGTMETLLISPAGREEIVLGKFLTIWVFSGGTALLNLVSMGVTTWLFSAQMPQAALSLGSLLWCVALLLPLSAFFSAICLAVGAYARSSKEGQYYLMPLFLITMPLMFLTLAPGVELNPFYSLVPVTGAALLMQKLMTSSSLAQVPWLYFVPVLAPIVLYSYLALRWAIDQFQREEVLFREAERIDVGLWIKHLFREKEETPATGQAFFMFGLLMALHWLSLSFGGALSIVTHTAVRELAFVATPPLLMTMLLNTKPLLGLRLKWPTLREIGLAALLAVLLLPPLVFASVEIIKQYPKLLGDRQPLVQELLILSEGRALGDGTILPFLLVFALLPAICEELAFRGFLLTGLQKHFRPRTAVLLCSFMFALYHMNVFQFLPSFFLGVVLGLLTLRSRSLVPAILLHLVYHGALIGGMHIYSDMRESMSPIVKDLWLPFIAICLLSAMVLLWRLYRAPYDALNRALAGDRARPPVSKVDRAKLGE